MRLCKCGCGEEVVQLYRQGKEQLYVDAKHRGRSQQRIRRERLRLAGLPVDPVPPSKQAEYDLNSRMRRRGLDPVAYREMLARQGGGCALCGKPPTSTRRLAIDHDHDCCPPQGGCFKCIRGLLCGECNRGIGLFRDNSALLRAAAAYVEREHEHSPKRKRCKRGHPYDIEWIENGRTVRRCSVCRRQLQAENRARQGKGADGDQQEQQDE